jgi:hypothetical protein
MKFPSDFSGRIIQVTEALDYGDAVSNQVISLDTLFKQMGFNAQIVSQWHHENVASFRKNLDELDADERDIVILHFYGYSEYSVNAVLNCNTTRIMIYHNITPADFFDRASSLYEFCKRGRQQLAEMWSKFHFFWADSAYNLDEIKRLGASEERCAVIPIIVPEYAVNSHELRESGSWLFVGRIAPNKRQLDIINLFSSVADEFPEAASRLYLVGGYLVDDPYYASIRAQITRLGLENKVCITGKVSDEEREDYYQRASVFVSLSAHEGFGVPLIEASLRDLPVVALNTSAVGDTLGFGLGVAAKEDVLRKQIIQVLTNSEIRSALLTEQKKNTRRFTPQAVELRLRDALCNVLPGRRQFSSVSIVICTYNRCAYLERVLDYLRFQTCPQFEVVIVDGPSNDGTKELLENYLTQVKIAHNQERNLSKSRNLGIELAAGDIVAFIDDDAIPFDDWVETILNEYNSRPLTTAGLGGPVYYAGTLKYQATDIGFNKYAEAIANVDLLRIGREGVSRSLLGTNSTFTIKSLVSVDGFDEQYDYFLDESELCFRLQERNFLVGYSSKLFLRHEFAESFNRSGKYNYNWFTISKNTAYFIAAYSGLKGKELRRYLEQRFKQERISAFEEALKAGELSKEERDHHIDSVWRGMKQGLEDARSFPHTRSLSNVPPVFLPFAVNTVRLRVGYEIKRLHICIISKEFPPFAARGGIGTLFYHLASELLLMGHDVTVITPTNQAHVFQQGRMRVLFAEKRDTGLQVGDAGFKNNMNWATSALVALSELHANHPVDVVESALWDTEALAIALLPRNQRPPVVVRLVTPFLVAAQINGWNVPENVASFFAGAERALIAAADAVVPISDSIAKTIEAEYGVQRDARWHKIYCGIAYWPFFDVNQGYASFEGFDKVPAKALESEKLLVFVGRLEQRKGIDLILQAANRFLAVDSDTQLLIAGRDVEGWVSRATNIIDSTLMSRVHFMGEVADSTRDKLMARAYCLLFPSRYESFGLVPLEAFVHGVPVIASNSGAIPEVVIDGDCGLLFRPDDSDSLADNVVTMLNDRALRDKMSENVKMRVKKLSSRNMALQSINLYNEISK